VGQVYKIIGTDATPIFAHAVETYLAAHTLAGAAALAAAIFEEATRPLAGPVHCEHGWTLHQLRHSMLTHEAENGTSTPTLLARSRHSSVHSLARYARPGPEAVAAHVAATDPAARRRR
jgi:integrase/recombinase XerD